MALIDDTGPDRGYQGRFDPGGGPLPAPTGIGRFQIEFSPVGGLPAFNYWTTIYSQYANSTLIVSLIDNFFQWVDQTANINAFWDDIWNIDTANGYGLDLQGRIHGYSRTIPVIDPVWFGFNITSLPAFPGTWSPFGQEAFWSGQPLLHDVLLDDYTFRRLILAKAFYNICDGSIPALNSILMALFRGRGNAYVTENPDYGPWLGFLEALEPFGTPQHSTPFGIAPLYNGANIPRMQMTYTFEFPITPLEYGYMAKLLDHSTGVWATIVEYY